MSSHRTRLADGRRSRGGCKRLVGVGDSRRRSIRIRHGRSATITERRFIINTMRGAHACFKRSRLLLWRRWAIRITTIRDPIARRERRWIRTAMRGRLRPSPAAAIHRRRAVMHTAAVVAAAAMGRRFIRTQFVFSMSKTSVVIPQYFPKQIPNSSGEREQLHNRRDIRKS